MSLRVLVDMNLSPEWVPFLVGNGCEAVHWQTVGAQNAPDEELMVWARANGCVVFTHDLDFGTTLALTHSARVSFNSAANKFCLNRSGNSSSIRSRPMSKFWPMAR